MASKLKATRNLLTVEGQGEELLLINHAAVRPLYIRMGRRYVLDFLEAASRLGWPAKIRKAFPGDAELLDSLRAHGILVPAGINEDTPPPASAGHRAPPGSRHSLSLYLLLSQSCNMGCVYCYNGRTSYRTDQNLTMGEAVAVRSVERCLAEVAPGGLLEVIFFGGEPLLNWPLAKAIVRHGEDSLEKRHPDKRIQYHMTSNLYFVPPDLIEWALAHHVSFLCDVDGPEPIHDACRPLKGGGPTHATVVRNIGRLTAAGVPVALRATVTALNQDRLMDIARHHKEIGGHSCAFVPVNPVNSDEDILEERLLPSPRTVIRGLAEVFESRLWPEDRLYPFSQYASRFCPEGKVLCGCGAPYGSTPVVDVRGDVYPCIYLVGIPRFHMGNILTDEYPRDEVTRRMCLTLHVDHLDGCRDCAWRYLCGGGCPLARLTVLNNPAASAGVKEYCREMLCAFSRETIELLLWRKARETASRVLENPASPDAARAADSVNCRR